MITFRGSQDAVLRRLYGFFTDAGFWHEYEILGRVEKAIRDVKCGAWLVVAASWVFEVVDPPMTLEQDVYGCKKGRKCSMVPAEIRPQLDAMITTRVAEGRVTDKRHFHWYWSLNHAVFGPDDVRAFVAETLGSPVVADTAHALYAALTRATSFPDNTDVHVTLFPDRMRLRIDNEGGQQWAGDLAKLPDVPGPCGESVNVAELLAERASLWGVVGEGGYSVWADFPRTPGDAASLASNYARVRAHKIPPGAYVYREDDHLAWVRVVEVSVAEGLVYLTAHDGHPLPMLPANKLVPIFAPSLTEPTCH